MITIPPLKLSVITVCLNEEKSILRTLLSIESQGYSNLELIICDGGSTDNTYQIYSEWKQRLDLVNYNSKSSIIDIVWLNQHSSGIYGAMNEAVSLATGDIVTFLNANDFFLNSSVCENAVMALTKDVGIEAVFGNVIITSENLWQRRIIESRYWKDWMLFWGFMSPQPGFFVRLKSFNEVGKFRETMRIASDFEWLIRFHVNNGFKSKWVNGICVVMTSGGVSSSGLKSWKLITSEMRESFELNGYKIGCWRLILRFPLKCVGVLRSLRIGRNRHFIKW